MSNKGIRKWVVVDKELNNWWKQNYPSHSMSFFFNKFIRHFKDAHTITPDQYAKIGAEALREEIVELT